MLQMALTFLGLVAVSRYVANVLAAAKPNNIVTHVCVQPAGGLGPLALCQQRPNTAPRCYAT